MAIFDQYLAMLSLVTSLIMTRLDYGSAVLAGLPSHLLNRLQSVLNAASRLVSRSQVRPRHSFAPGPALVTGSGKNPVSTCRTCFLLSLTISIGLMKRNHGIDYDLVPVHAWSFLELGSAPLAIDHFVWLLHKHGTVFLPTSLHQLLYRLSRENLKHFYLPNLSHHF